MNIFLTGGTGFIGKHIVKRMRGRGWRVTTLVRNPDSEAAKAIQNEGVTLVQGDITDKESMRSAMADTDAVVHNAAWYEFGVNQAAKERMRGINVDGARNTLSLAVELGVAKIVHVSTVLAYGDTGDKVADESFKRSTEPLSAYEATKLEAHEFALSLQREGAPLVIAGPAGVIGCGDHSAFGVFSRMYVRGQLPPVLFAGEGSRSHVHVEDCAEGIVRSAERGQAGETYLLASNPMTHRASFELWRETPGGSQTTWFYAPNGLAYGLMRVVEPIERMLGIPPVFNREMALTGFAQLNFSGAKAEQDLEMTFRSSEQAWRDTLACERQRAGR